MHTHNCCCGPPCPSAPELQGGLGEAIPCGLQPLPLLKGLCQGTVLLYSTLLLSITVLLSGTILLLVCKSTGVLILPTCLTPSAYHPLVLLGLVWFGLVPPGNRCFTSLPIANDQCTLAADFHRQSSPIPCPRLITSNHHQSLVPGSFTSNHQLTISNERSTNLGVSATDCNQLPPPPARPPASSASCVCVCVCVCVCRGGRRTAMSSCTA